MDDVFEKIYGIRPQFDIRCPGRVNLIGEHIDYNGYGVLPMAIENHTQLLIAETDDDVIEIRSDDAGYSPFKMNIPSSWSDASPPSWFDYVLCGWRGVIDAIGATQKGLRILMTCDIPPSAGLSSSSSLVCAASLATLIAHTGDGFTEKYTREWLADLCAVSERMIGTQGGGMDQAAEILATDGAALRIDFAPLTTRRVQLPEDALFVVLHSGDTLNKAATSQYNERVVECRIAAQILGKHLQIPDWSSLRRLKEVQEKGEKPLDEMLELLESVLPKTGSRDDVIQLIGKESFENLLSENTKNMTSFVIRARARHCYSEAHRVDLFEKACQKGDLEGLGKLMNDSHNSCQVDYECSSEGLDQLVAECRNAGVLGARLTGAGWGGCAVVLMNKNQKVDLNHLNVLFESVPSRGIDLYRL